MEQIRITYTLTARTCHRLWVQVLKKILQGRRMQNAKPFVDGTNRQKSRRIIRMCNVHTSSATYIVVQVLCTYSIYYAVGISHQNSKHTHTRCKIM
jgi:hypothetical protein